MPQYARIILPLALDQTYTYEIPTEMQDQVDIGSRVEIQFGSKKLYAGIVHEITQVADVGKKIKSIQSVLDDSPILGEKQLSLWKWIANYYMCSLGEVMLAALPGGLKLASETIIVRNEEMIAEAELHSDDEFLILEALEFQEELTVAQIQQIVNKKTVFPLINKMLYKNLILTKEELNHKYKAKVVSVITLNEAYVDKIADAVSLVEKYEKQVNCLLAFIPLSKNHEYVTKTLLQKKADVGYSTIKSLIKKGILDETDREVSRLGDLALSDHTELLPPLNPEQIRALSEIEGVFVEKDVCLLHGVTGSGKTRIYVELIKKAISEGRQVLYLLPEIALTTHFIGRLQTAFGEAVTTYHSRLNPNQRAEVFQKSRHEIQILVGPRSSIFLPFENLGLIIIDESHDYSFKQQDPAPRYHGRDTAVVLAKLQGAKVIMGTATPACETYYNAMTKKYGYVELPDRVKELKPPEIIIYAINKIPRDEIVESFSKYLLKTIRENFEEGKQTLIFRNRRGYAPVLKCEVCGWNAECIHCDVALTYHKSSDAMRCHYCGFRTPVTKACPDCGNTKLQLKGSGTEKLEEALSLIMPEAKVDRLDADTASGKAKMGRILQQFEAGETDVLIGTQMITKGLDFENVGLVGVILADALMYYPDFRSEERAHQILSQVSGRAGRTYDKSQVIIQTYQPSHHIFSSLSWEGQRKFFNRILHERKQFLYPPFVKFIQMQFFHKDFETVLKCSEVFVERFKTKSSMQVLGPVTNPIKRIRSKYIMNCVVKLKKNERARKEFYHAFNAVVAELNEMKWSRSVRISVNVDPY
jgi:primosomal protein N' (replication factor Y)